MDRKPPNTSAEKGAETREARLKAALKSNIARRKAQARARGAKAADADGTGQKKES
ncbi:hypothetical protein OEW28_16530 [Defluviimonas sp. WL0002]|uniref:Uncharacterized protein n=1 Tax=Albidovulum marisflavi TaxID=2984159 RepID=A0ABT2ZGG5_9RHOB|nr:hypothetical protein [Defluviimonas sp. WL0002]MCV2870233.1 hypothetical protein [Defluviimonas sp. WL0002]